MKGFIACVLCAVEDLDRASLARPIHIALSYDEEVGCIGVRGLLETVALAQSNDRVRPHLVLIGEPTMMRPRHAHLGKVAYRIDFTAAAAHSSLSPFLPSAITSAVRVVNAVQEVADLYRQSATRDESGEGNSAVTVNVGSIRGGGALNVLAEHCELTFELRHDRAHDPDELLAAVHDAIARETDTLRACGGGVEVVEIARYPALATDSQNPWVRVVERAADRGASTPLGFGTEGGLFAEALQTTVMVCGPGDIGVAHKADEYVSVEQLRACMSFLARLIDDVCVMPHHTG
jgi:acetylornithine deacetylase